MHDTQPNIVLVGFMGTGKTSAGKILAEQLGMTFLDMDEEIVRREGRSIPEIFGSDGEAYFREVERSLVRELAEGSGRVIATGGGVVLNPANIDDFSRTGSVVCLWASPEWILKRVGGDTNRPLLQVDDKLGKIRSMLEARKSLYEAIPERIDTDGQSPGETAVVVIRRVRPDAAP